FYVWVCPPPPAAGVCRLLSSVMSGTESHADREEDYRFLHSMLMEKKLHLLFKIHERLKRFEKRSPIPVQEHAARLASDLVEELIYHGWRDEVKELVDLFSKPHFKSLLFVHDAVARRDFEPSLPPVPEDALVEDEDSVKIVSLVKTKEPLVTCGTIFHLCLQHFEGLIHEGDELKEVNGVSLENRKPKEILPLLVLSQGNVTFTIIPASSKEEIPSSKKKLFVRALFDYDANEDPSVPCRDAAVSFKRGDVLQIVSKEDVTWWQACYLGDSKSRAGLIPSQQLQERRVALQQVQGLSLSLFPAGLRRSFRLGRKSSWAREVAGSRRWSGGVHGSFHPPTYIEVIPYHRDPKDKHRLVILVGPNGLGVSELKRRLLISDPDRYGVTVPYTTREKKRLENEGTDYHFVSVHMFEEDLLNHRFIEYGRYRGHYYGTSLDSVHRVMADGKVCLLDAHPSTIKHVYTSEFKPYVVFVKPPCIEELRLTRRRVKFICDEEDTNPVREEDLEDMIHLAETMENQYGHLFDKVIVNGDVAGAFRELKADLEKTEAAEVQWLPAEWNCSPPTTGRRSTGHLIDWI
uniref:MAGUK p55 subfamily member 7-like n=1 Tax=Scophthalmus maximus TaxID=52904 RepID=A0A8D3AJF1_SCOMX